MRIIFIRHGDPDYVNDCLTDLGRLQASAVAERLADENITQIYSSTKGRALETAGYTADRIGCAEVIPCEFMREISWKSMDGSELYRDGHPWYTAYYMVANGLKLLDRDWAGKAPFANNIVCEIVQSKTKVFDEWLAQFGYRREGCYYRVESVSDKTIAMFSHAGSSSAVIGHMLNLTFPFMCGVMEPDFTGVTTVKLIGKEGDLITPRIEIFNDARHMVCNMSKGKREDSEKNN